ncbi:MAG: TonB C-terminal domain-containing protein [Victivallaceae bacterium]|nr:TonB C-terminal domain-containing protein [Victivallaceae bacterium]
MKYKNINLTTDQQLKSGEMVSRATRRKIRRTVIITHIAVVLVPFLVLMVYQWFKPTPPERIRVRLVQMPPAADSDKHAATPAKKVQKPKAKPKKKKKKKTISKPKPKKKTVSKPKPKPKKKPKPATKRKILSANDIKISQNVVKTKTPKKLSPADLEKKILKSWKKVKYPVKATARYSGKVIAAYSDTVGAYLEPIWEQPDKVSLGGRFPEVTIRIDIGGNGRVSGSRIIRHSGISVMDGSVDKLLKNLKHVPPPPDKRAKSVTIIMAIEK